MSSAEVPARWEYPDGRRVPAPCRPVVDAVGDHYPWVGSSLAAGYQHEPVPGDDDVRLLLSRAWARRYALDLPNGGWTGSRLLWSRQRS